MCEIGREVEDTLVRINQVAFGGEDGRQQNPPAIVLMFGLHHSAAMSMVLPMNIYYPDNVYYHEGAFLLQSAAFLALSLQQYGFTLDTKTKEGLRRMKVVISMSLATLL